MHGWRAYYPDGSTVDSQEVPPDDLRDGVVCIVTYLEPPYRELVSGGDWYIWEGKRWSSTETGEWGEWLPEPDGEVTVRSCERHPQDQIESVMDQAMEDREWPM